MPPSIEFDCTASEQALLDRLDGLRVAEPAALERHLAVCSPCRGLHAAAGRMEEGLRARRLPVPPAGLTDRIVRAVLEERSREPRWPRRVVRTVALAASVFLVFLAGEQRTRDLLLPPAPDQPPAAVSLRASMEEAGNAVVNLTTRTADETVGQTRLLLPVVTTPPLDDPMPMPPVEPPMRSVFAAGQGVSAGLEPVTNSARRALGLFLRDVPMSPETKPGI